MLNKISSYINITNITNLDNLFINLINVFDRGANSEIFSAIKFVMIDKFDYDPNLSKNQIVIKICKQRLGQNTFREQIVLRDKKCLITGDNYEVCEGAHIIPYSESKSFDVSNGILLNRCFHKMFDSYDMSFNESNCVVFSQYVSESKDYEHYTLYLGKKINVDTNTQKNLRIHYERFLERNKFDYDLA